MKINTLHYRILYPIKFHNMQVQLLSSEPYFWLQFMEDEHEVVISQMNNAIHFDGSVHLLELIDHDGNDRYYKLIINESMMWVKITMDGDTLHNRLYVEEAKVFDDWFNNIGKHIHIDEEEDI